MVDAPQGSEAERRKGLVRVPFVRRCHLRFGDGRSASGYIVNMNVLGAYLTPDDGTIPALGDTVACRFPAPDRDLEIETAGTVTWVNTRQQHPVHGLPVGFGLKFASLEGENLRAIEEVVEQYLRRQA